MSVPACLSNCALKSNLSPKQNTCLDWKSIKFVCVCACVCVRVCVCARARVCALCVGVGVRVRACKGRTLKSRGRCEEGGKRREGGREGRRGDEWVGEREGEKEGGSVEG